MIRRRYLYPRSSFQVQRSRSPAAGAGKQRPQSASSASPLFQLGFFLAFNGAFVSTSSFSHPRGIGWRSAYPLDCRARPFSSTTADFTSLRASSFQRHRLRHPATALMRSLTMEGKTNGEAPANSLCNGETSNDVDHDGSNMSAHRNQGDIGREGKEDDLFVAVVQMCSINNKAHNFARTSLLVEKAVTYARHQASTTNAFPYMETLPDSASWQDEKVDTTLNRAEKELDDQSGKLSGKGEKGVAAGKKREILVCLPECAAYMGESALQTVSESESILDHIYTQHDYISPLTYARSSDNSSNNNDFKDGSSGTADCMSEVHGESTSGEVERQVERQEERQEERQGEMSAAATIPIPYVSLLSGLARTHDVWISVGGFPERRVIPKRFPPPAAAVDGDAAKKSVTLNSITSSDTSVTATATTDLGAVKDTNISINDDDKNNNNNNSNNNMETETVMSNTHFLIDPLGRVVLPLYRKIHLFDSPLTGLMESRNTVAGDEIVRHTLTRIPSTSSAFFPQRNSTEKDRKIAETADESAMDSADKINDLSSSCWRVGLSVCYDLRFPTFYQALCKGPDSTQNHSVCEKNNMDGSRERANEQEIVKDKKEVKSEEERLKGAYRDLVDLVLVPSAFTQVTGRAHWSLLLRARAVENQCYVVAAAQSGQHNARRCSYGHSMIVDPWGEIVAELGEEREGFCVAALSKERLRKIRQGMPVQLHRRDDLYKSNGCPSAWKANL